MEHRPALVRMAAWFNQNRGILTVCELIRGRLDQDILATQEREADMNLLLQREGILAFAEVDVVDQLEAGMVQIAQASGLGGLRTNTVVLGWPTRQERLAALLSVIRALHQIGKAGILIRSQPFAGPQRFDRIDIWWRGKENCGDLMMLLAYLLTMNPLWRRARITVRSIVDDEASREDMEESLDVLIGSVRIKAHRHVMVRADGKSVPDLIREVSRDADVVFLGLRLTDSGQEAQHAQWLTDLLAGLPTTILVRSGGPFAGKLI